MIGFHDSVVSIGMLISLFDGDINVVFTIEVPDVPVPLVPDVPVPPPVPVYITSVSFKNLKYPIIFLCDLKKISGCFSFFAVTHVLTLFWEMPYPKVF